MKILVVLLTSFLFSRVWSENTNFHGEDLIDPSDMLHYDAASQTMRTSKQKKINTMLQQYLEKTLENAEKLGQPITDEDTQYHAEVTLSSQILRDFLKCIKESQCDPIILEKHLQNTQLRSKHDDDNFPMVFDRVLEVAIFFYILVGFLDLVKDFTLSEWLICMITLVFKLFWTFDFKVFTGFIAQWDRTIEDVSIIIYIIILRVTVTLAWKCLKKIFHKKQHAQEQHCLQNLGDQELCLSIQELPVPCVNDEVVECNRRLSNIESPERPQGRSKSSTDGFKNSGKDKEQLQKQPKGPTKYIDSISSTAVPKLLEYDNQHGAQDLSDSFLTSENLDPDIEETSGSPSFVVIEEQEDS